MKKENGFTLIELLAVIVILAIIAVIATPLTINVINDAKERAFVNSVYGLMDGLKLLSAEQLFNDGKTQVLVNFENGVADNINFKVSGDMPDYGTVHLNSDGKIELKVWDEELGKCAEKSIAESKIKFTESSKENCKISTKLPEVTGADGKFKYAILPNGKIQLTRYLSNETNVVIPAEYDGYQVYSVGNQDANPDNKNERYNIFGATNSIKNTTVTSITISEGIEVIETAAFSYCTGWVGELTLPSTLKKIGAFAFNHCEQLTGNITIPEGVTKIGDAAFQSSKNFDGVLTMPSTLEEIGTSTFNQLEKLTNETIVIPKSLKIIGRASGNSAHTFYNVATKTIKEFVVDPENPYYKAVDGVLMSMDGKRLVSYPGSKEGNVYEIPEGVTVIDELSFSRNGSTYSGVPDTGLKKLILPNSYILTTSLPDCYINSGNNLAVALYLYTGVSEIAVKDDNPNYKTIDGVLYSKDGTTLWYVPIHKTGAIEIPEGVTTIKDGAFYNSSSKVTSIYIPATVTSIEAKSLSVLQSLSSSKVTFAEGSKYYFSSSKVISTK